MKLVLLCATLCSGCLLDGDSKPFEHPPGSIEDRQSWDIDPSVHVFGEVIPGDDAAASFMLHKYYGAPIQEGYIVTISDETNFVITDACNRFADTELEGSCVFWVTYQPQSSGNHEAFVSVGPWQKLHVSGSSN